jgi:hypothetical protein
MLHIAAATDNSAMCALLYEHVNGNMPGMSGVPR